MTKELFSVEGNIVDLYQKRIFPGRVFIEDGEVSAVKEETDKNYSKFILPGFIDSHVHIESSMLAPCEFARKAVVHGTVAAIADPQKIANVLGIEGVRYLVKNGEMAPFHFFFGAPACVPTTKYETAGGSISVDDIFILFARDRLHFLAEVTNYFDVLDRKENLMDKINLAKEFDRPIDGHAPGLKGMEAVRYISAGISTDNECLTLDEALHKIDCGMKIQIGEGSSGGNFDVLHHLIYPHHDKVMFCSNDILPQDLLKGHINKLVKKAINEYEYDPLDVLQCACLNPVRHYGLDVGMLQVGDPADFIIVDNWKDLTILETYIRGVKVASKGESEIHPVKPYAVNNFSALPRKPREFRLRAKGTAVKAIIAEEGHYITKMALANARLNYGYLESNLEEDTLKIVVINRYEEAAPMGMGFIKNFGLKKGALASSISRNCHNIVAVGVGDLELCIAVNEVIRMKGGIAVAFDGRVESLPLKIAGIMSDEEAPIVAAKYVELESLAKELGCTLKSPFVTLSFMSLIVLPQLKLSDLGLFDGSKFNFTDVLVEE